eukprot:556215-Hanusia_phi.AAC.1
MNFLNQHIPSLPGEAELEADGIPSESRVKELEMRIEAQQRQQAELISRLAQQEAHQLQLQKEQLKSQARTDLPSYSLSNAMNSADNLRRAVEKFRNHSHARDNRAQSAESSPRSNVRSMSSETIILNDDVNKAAEQETAFVIPKYRLEKDIKARTKGGKRQVQVAEVSSAEAEYEATEEILNPEVSSKMGKNALTTPRDDSSFDLRA